jgi:hypothetical protein
MSKRLNKDVETPKVQSFFAKYETSSQTGEQKTWNHNKGQTFVSEAYRISNFHLEIVHHKNMEMTQFSLFSELKSTSVSTRRTTHINAQTTWSSVRHYKLTTSIPDSSQVSFFSGSVYVTR